MTTIQSIFFFFFFFFFFFLCEPYVELRGVTKTFRTPRAVVPAVRGIDVSIAAGETVALLGPNGAGKSTTIDMLLWLI